MLMSNLRYADATLLGDEEKWWPFAAVQRGLFTLNRDPFGLWANWTFGGKWNPHPANSRVKELNNSPSAGRVFELSGRGFRPSGNCLIHYGHGLRINEILRLETKGYQEHLVAEGKADREAYIRANHHVD